MKMVVLNEYPAPLMYTPSSPTGENPHRAEDGVNVLTLRPAPATRDNVRLTLLRPPLPGASSETPGVFHLRYVLLQRSNISASPCFPFRHSPPRSAESYTLGGAPRVEVTRGSSLDRCRS